MNFIWFALGSILGAWAMVVFYTIIHEEPSPTLYHHNVPMQPTAPKMPDKIISWNEKPIIDNEEIRLDLLLKSVIGEN